MSETHSRPRISVVISTYNSASFLHSCLTQMLEQSALPECEVIVIDSGSQQDEAAVCAAMRTAFPRLVYERTARETIYASWNRALSIAQGEYFVNVNTDDALHPNALAVLRRVLDKHADAVIAYGDWVWANVPNAAYPWNMNSRHIRHCDYHPAIPLFYCYTGCMQFWRTVSLRELGGFNSQRWAAGDYEALCEIVRRCWAAAYVPAVLSAFYQNPSGLSLATDRSFQEFCAIRDNLRSTTSISAIFDIDETDGRACANAWLAVAKRALVLHVPWAAVPEPDFRYARYAAEKAVMADRSNKDARMLVQALGERRTLWGRLVRRKTLSLVSSTALPMTEPPPKTRPIVIGEQDAICANA